MERHHFDDELRALRHAVLQMGEAVITRLEQGVAALSERRPDLAAAVVAGDGDVNAFHRDIDARAFRLLALQQPAARDLRFLATVMKANDDLERIGDQAVNVAGTTERLLAGPPLENAPDVRGLAGLAIAMTRDALTAFLDWNGDLARDVLAREEQADAARERVFRALVDRMRADPQAIERCLGLILLSRNFERVADHATNIAEDAIFLAEARDVRHRHAEA